MDLPEIYLPVSIHDKRLNKFIGNGFVDTRNKITYIFSSKRLIEYNADETKEVCILYNLLGAEYDLEKLFN